MKRRRIVNAALFLLIVLASFCMRTYHYNTSVIQLASMIDDVPERERPRMEYVRVAPFGMRLPHWRMFLPFHHANFSPFTIESAMMFSYAQDVANGKGVPASDPTLCGMEDIAPYAQMNMGLEWFLGWGWRVKQWIAPDPPPTERETVYQDNPRMAQWMSAQMRLWASLTSGLIFLWLLILRVPRVWAVGAGLLHAVALAGIARATGQDLVRGEFCIPLVMASVVLAYWTYANPKAWKWIPLFATTFLAFVTWDLCQMLFSCWCLVELLRLALGFRAGRGRVIAWTAIAAAVLLNALVVPFNVQYCLIRSPLIWAALPSLFFAFWFERRIRSRDFRFRRVVRFAAIAGVFVALHFGVWKTWGNTPEYASNYDHFSTTMKAKLEHFNVKPSDPALLEYDARMMWTPSMHSATWEIATSFFPSFLFGRQYSFLPLRFLLGDLPLSLGLCAALLFGVALFRIPREEFLKTISMTLLPFVFAVGFTVGFIYIVRYHEFLIIFLCVSLALLGTIFWKAFRWAPEKVDPALPYTKLHGMRRLLLAFRILLVVPFIVLLLWETLISLNTMRRYTGDVAMRETAQLIAWFRSARSAVEGQGVAANFTIGPMLKAYAGCGIAMNPQFGMKRIRDATQEYIQTLYYGTEDELAEYCESRNVRYVVYNHGATHPSGVYGTRYIAGPDPLPDSAPAVRMNRAPERLKNFVRIPMPEPYRSMSFGRVYSVFRLIRPEERKESMRCASKGYAAFALFRLADGPDGDPAEALTQRNVARAMAKKAVELDPKSRDARDLFQSVYGREPELTLEGVR